MSTALPDPLQGALADRYRLERELGRGAWLRSTSHKTSGTTGQ
jgi:hypothetical protein